jgi:hypothetical protein
MFYGAFLSVIESVEIIVKNYKNFQPMLIALDIFMLFLVIILIFSIICFLVLSFFIVLRDYYYMKSELLNLRSKLIEVLK